MGAETAAPAPPGTLARTVLLPDGRHIRMTCAGSGSPTVILEAGLDWGGSWSWLQVLTQAGQFTHVCAYDRAGTGFSDAGPMPRDAVHIASDLHALLRAAAEKPPYVLVGQSLGGALVRLYRARYASEVAALVLVDPSQPGPNEWRVPWLATFKECLKLANEQAITHTTKNCMPPGMDNPPPFVVEVARKPGTWKTALSEIEHVNAYFDELESTEHAPFSTPLIVLTASEQSALDKAALAEWIAGHKRIATQSSRGEQRLVPGSSHGIQVDRPEVVVHAIHDAISQTDVSP